jgi:hypothetical protein
VVAKARERLDANRLKEVHNFMAVLHPDLEVAVDLIDLDPVGDDRTGRSKRMQQNGQRTDRVPNGEAQVVFRESPVWKSRVEFTPNTATILVDWWGHRYPSSRGYAISMRSFGLHHSAQELSEMGNQSLNRRDALRMLAVGGVASAVVVGSSPASADEIDLAKEVPAPVLAAANSVLPGVKWTTAHKVSEKGNVLYDIEGTQNGREVSAEVTAAGKVMGVDREILPKDVPAAVTKAATGKYPKFKVEHAFEVYAGDNIQGLVPADVVYELEGPIEKGHDTITITPEGKIITAKIEVEMKAVPKAVHAALKKKAPKFKPVHVHKLEEDGVVAGYLFAGDVKKEKKEHIVFVSADGKEVEVYHDE